MNFKPLCAYCGEPLGKHRVYMLTAMELLAEEASTPALHNDCVTAFTFQGIRYGFPVQVNSRVEPHMTGGSISLRHLPQCSPIKAFADTGEEATREAILADLEAALQEALSFAFDQERSDKFEQLMHERHVKWRRILTAPPPGTN